MRGQGSDLAAQPGVPEEKRKFCQNLTTLAAKLGDGLVLDRL
ncbi:hypothetical protein CBM2588_P70017 [Cupriavidus taiwanensis]|nr:hypothetical protein CBM2588_P70017 [Cupriavidus taiwanensis]SOZ76908.1 hypothetical protein CBM2617_P70017 [Cupriavidus taiwanensis]